MKHKNEFQGQYKLAVTGSNPVPTEETMGVVIKGNDMCRECGVVPCLCWPLANLLVVS